MYNARYETNGETFLFGKDGLNVVDIDIGNGVPVNLGTSQGFAQIGETVDTQSVKGRTITVKGVIYDDVVSQKVIMRKIFVPFSGGKLTFKGNYSIDVIVQNPPTFSPVKNDGRFTMQLFAPFPYLSRGTQYSDVVGGITPGFSFPVNYAEPHTFGMKSEGPFIDIINDGESVIPFGLEVEIVGRSSNITVTNLITFDFLKINGSFENGERLHVWRNSNNVLTAELTTVDGDVVDIISRIDEDSTLFELAIGENKLSINDDEGGGGMIAKISYSPVVVAWYES